MSPELVLREYFRAKDENRPHRLRRVFTADARLEVRNRASGIELPAESQGREAIADALVRRFNQTYENIYSFYLARPPADAAQFACDWLVGMTEKANGQARLGCGRYDWTFGPAPERTAVRLVITIERMELLPPASAETMLRWLLELDYPWTTAAAVGASRFPSEARPVVDHLLISAHARPE